MDINKRLRHYCLTGVTTRMMVSCIGKINYPELCLLNDLLAAKIKKTRKVKMTTPAGCNIEFLNYENQPLLNGTGMADVPGTHFMAGQISWTPQLDSVNGAIVLDGSVAPAVGLIGSPIAMQVENGRVIAVEGGNDAKIFKEWMYSFNNEQMLKIAHTGIGFNPQARLSGDLLEDQRVFGSATWAVGSIGAALLPPDGVSAPSHSDGGCLNTSVWFDGEQVLENGRFVEPELNRLVKGLS
jgi:leucyl aminopeptidase (aminopeptidase T)